MGNGKLHRLFKKSSAVRHIFKNTKKLAALKHAKIASLKAHSKPAAGTCKCTGESMPTTNGLVVKGKAVHRMGASCRKWEKGDKKAWCYVAKSCVGASAVNKPGAKVSRYQFCDSEEEVLIELMQKKKKHKKAAYSPKQVAEARKVAKVAGEAYDAERGVNAVAGLSRKALVNAKAEADAAASA